jgi:probable HAF family extracellular repeat protein
MKRSRELIGWLAVYFCLLAAPAPAGMIDLGTLGGSLSEAKGINNYGQIVGDATNPEGEFHPFLYTGVPGASGHMTDLGPLGPPLIVAS